MALVIGTNCGFVGSAPSGDPSGNNTTDMDGRNIAVKDTSPAGNNVVTEIGWWQGMTTNDSATYEAGIYSHDSGNNSPDTLIGSVATGQSCPATTAQWNKYTGLNISISGSTVYWIAVGIVGVTNPCSMDRDTISGARRGYVADANGTLDASWGASFTASDDNMLGIYAVYEEASASGNPMYYYAQMAQRIKDKWRNLIRIPGFDEIMAFQRSLKGAR